MLTRLIALPLLCLVTTRAVAQNEPPIVHSNSRVIDIRDGDRLRKGEWIADPSNPLDTFRVQRSERPKVVTVITDVESQSFTVPPGGEIDLVILLNGKDECHTRLSMKATPAHRADGAPAGPISIPMTIVRGKPHIQGRINNSATLDLLFDTGADTTVLYPSGQRKGAALSLDGSLLNSGTGGVVVRQTSSDNRLAIGPWRWDHEPVMLIDKQADSADGIVGYNVFEDRIVELDFDRMILVVHEALPAHAATYSKARMPYLGTLTAIDGVIANGAAQSAGPFVVDTGGTGALMGNRALLDHDDVRASLRVLGKSVSGGVGPQRVRNEVLLVPRAEFAGYSLHDVPIHVPLPEGEVLAAAISSEAPRGVLCMEVLSRFNLILDYQSNEAYLKPNARYQEAFEMPGPNVAGVVIAASLGALLIATIAVIMRRRRAMIRSTSDPARHPA